MKKNLLTIALAIIVVFSVNAQRSNSLTKAKHRGGTKTCESTISMVTSEFFAGTTVDLVFEYEYVSPDVEWVDGVSLQFPAGVTVNSATTCTEAGGELTYNGETGDGALSSWGDLAGGSGWGSLHTNGNFSVNVTIADDFSGDMTLDWFIAGDGYAAEPHTNSGSFDIIQTYTVTFVVDDGANPVQNANIFIEDKELVTNTNGEATIELPDGEYFFGIITTGFENYTGTATVYSETVTIQVHLTAGTAEWPVIFYVTGEDDEPLVGANVELGTYSSTVTDADGEAFFMVSDEANITYTVTMTNYDAETYTITVDGAVLEKDVQLFLTTYSVTFTANDWKGGVVQDAEITVDGETILTDVNGEAVFTLAIDTYDFSVSAEGLVYTGTTTLDVVDQDVNIDVVLYEEIIVPSVTATDNGDDGAVIEWTVELQELRHDDGIATGQLGFTPGSNNGVMGTVYNNNADISEISWYLTDGSAVTVVNLFIFGLKADGTPDESNVLFQEMGVESPQLQWNTFELPSVISAPEGFYVALSCDNAFLGLAIDDGVDEPYVAEAGSTFYSSDYTAGAWTDMFADYPNNFLLRVTAIDHGAITKSTTNMKATKQITETTENQSLTYVALENPIVTQTNIDAVKTSKSAQTFNLYYLEEADLNTPANWTEVAMNLPSTTTTYTDIDNWPVTIDGVYYWAVVANYETGASDAGISNALEFYNTYSADFTVTASFGTNELIDGASINITDNDEVTIDGTTVSGVFTTELSNGEYDYTVTAEGYVTATGSFTVADGATVPVALDEAVQTPFGVIANITSDTVNVSWNNDLGFFDDFESYDDFSLTFDPWTLLDIDASATYGFQGVTFTNMGSPMAGIIFNPSQTDPVLDDNFAYSGEKYIAIFNATSLLDNDWIIAPLTQIVAGTQVSFQAKAGSGNYSAEKFQVFVSKTGLNPSDFTAVSGIETTPSNEWAEYSYDLSSYAGKEVYVAIQCTSADQFYLCIDDFNIGQASTKSLQTYDLYFLTDGQQDSPAEWVEVTTGIASDIEEYTDTNNWPPAEYGNYLYALIAQYETEASAPAFSNVLEFATSVESMKSDVNVYPNPSNGLFTVSVNGTYSLQVIDITGKVISTQEITNTESINLQEAGVYMLRLTNNVETLNYKVIVK